VRVPARANLHALQQLRQALKEGTSVEVQKQLHAERVEKERLMAEVHLTRRHTRHTPHEFYIQSATKTGERQGGWEGENESK
jgi:hypothetical protein